MAATAASATAVGGSSATGGGAATDGGANAGETDCAASSAIRSTSVVGGFFLPNEISFFHTETFCFGSAASHSTFCLRPNEISFFHIDDDCSAAGAGGATGTAGAWASTSAGAAAGSSPFGFFLPNETSFFQNESAIC